MFNGIIYSTGLVDKVFKAQNSIEIVIKTELLFNKKEIGSSVCCNGACLTVTKIKKNLIIRLSFFKSFI